VSGWMFLLVRAYVCACVCSEGGNAVADVRLFPLYLRNWLHFDLDVLLVSRS